MEAGQKNNPAGNPRENITLFEGVKTDMGKYDVTFVKDSFDAAGKRYFNIQFENKKTKETFTLYPDILKNNKMEGYAANPAAKHYWNQDIFIYITSYRDDTGEDTTKFHPVAIAEGDSVFYSNGYIKLSKVLVNPKADIPAGTNQLQLQLDVVSKEGIHYLAQPSISVSSNNMMQQQWDTVKAQNLILSFNKVLDPSKRTLEIGVRESKALTDLITLKVYAFPYINILWIGVIVMTLGFCLSAYNRLLKK
jgi:cytochrome c-type biogenesis protein CcmF